MSLSFSDRLFGRSVEQNEIDQSRGAAENSESQLGKSQAKREEPQSSGTKNLEPILSSPFEVEQKRRDSLTSELTDESFWLPDVEEEKLVKLVGSSIWQIALANPQKRRIDEGKIFEGETIPHISLGDYLCRLRKYINKLFPSSKSAVWTVTPGMRSVVMALIYVDRLVEKEKGIEITCYNIHRLCMAAVFIAAKYLEDDALPKSFLSNVAGLSKKQLAKIETAFCCQVEFDLRVTEEDFIQTYSMISRPIHR